MENIQNILLFAGMSLIPIIGWLWFFNREHPCKRKFVIFSFLAGMLSIVPIKLYERYWDKAVFYLEHINLFEHISDLTHIPEISRFFAFITASAVVALIIFLFVMLMMLLFEVFSGDNTFEAFRKKAKKIIEAPFLFLSVGVLIGIMAYFLSDYLHSKIWFFVIVGMLEEFVKHLVVRFTDDEKIKSIADAISFSIIIALGFAFIENTLYFLNFSEVFSQDLEKIGIFFLLRSIFPVLGHVCFSAILGYFYGIAHFSDEIYAEEVQRREHIVLEKVHKVLGIKGENIFHEAKMLEGLLFAMIIHAIFNSLLEFEMISVLIPFLIILFWWTIKSLHFQKCNIIHHRFFLSPSIS